MPVMTSKPPERASAEATVHAILLDALPPEATPSFQRIFNARFTGHNRLTANVVLVDGQRAEIEVWQWRADGWAHRWLRFDGGDLCWEDGRWWRISEQGERVAIEVVSTTGEQHDRH